MIKARHLKLMVVKKPSSQISDKQNTNQHYFLSNHNTWSKVDLYGALFSPLVSVICLQSTQSSLALLTTNNNWNQGNVAKILTELEMWTSFKYTKIGAPWLEYRLNLRCKHNSATINHSWSNNPQSTPTY